MISTESSSEQPAHQMINQYLNVFIVPHQSPLGGWEDVRILRGAPPKPQSFLNQTRRSAIQKYSKQKHKANYALALEFKDKYKYLQNSKSHIGYKSGVELRFWPRQG